MGGRKDERGERLTPEATAAVGEFLDSHTTMALATAGEDGPWAAALFFARDADLNLYFISAESTRHAAHIAHNPKVAATVNRQHDDWFDIRGLQIEGVAEPVPHEEREAVIEIYLAKFPTLRPLFASPRSEQERRIAKAFAASPFYRMRPRWIRFIDNTKDFGHSAEFALD